MSAPSKDVAAFVATVHRRKNRHELWTTLLLAVAAAAAALIVVGLCFVVRGYALPGRWIASILAASAILAAGAWLARRFNSERAARFADRFFDLHDTITSCLHFSAQGRGGGYYALQAEQAAERVAGLDAAMVRYRPSKRLTVLAAGLVAVAVPISLRPDSEEVRERTAMEQAIETVTTSINADLVKEAQKLIDDARDQEEQKLLQPEKLKKWIDELKATKDRAEALRQYAGLERKLNAVRQSLHRKGDEQLLERAAAELAKGEETRPMAETLSKKEYDKAAKQLQDLKPSPKKKPEERRRDLARLKTTAQRMAAAAKTQSRNTKGRSASKNAAKECDPKSPAEADRDNPEDKAGDADEDSLSDAVEELAEAAEKCDKLDPRDAKLLDCEKILCQWADDVAGRLKYLALCRKADSRLAKLCRRCGQCQSNCESPDAGGHKAGWGTNTARRTETDPLIDNGQTTQLTGIQGSGPSVTTVEAADSGSGASTRRGAARDIAFKHQYEAFVQREDVPEAVKHGVKEYFQIIHEADNDASSGRKSKE